MKVIFIEDVPRVARVGDTKEVADGYARNYLLPRKLAVLANSKAAALVEVQLKKKERMMAQTEAEMAEVAAKLNGMSFTLKAKAGAKERLYGSITSADIADEIKNSANLVVDRRKIELAEPIHKLGSYDVAIRFTHEIIANIKLTIAGEGVVGEKEEKKVEAKVEEEFEATAEEAEKKEKKAEKEEEAKAEEKAEKKEKKVKAEKKEKKHKAEKELEKVEEVKAEEKAEKKEKKPRAKKKVEEAKAGE